LSEGKSYPLWVALDQITDPHNFGAIVRSAVAFGVDGVIILKDRSVAVNATAVRASAGATEYAKIARVTNLVRALQQAREGGVQVVGLDGSASEPLHAYEYPLQGRVLVVGSEGKGLRRLVREQCDHLARIELTGPIASLNASVAASIAIYQSMRQRPSDHR
jgi:23S rRNA (guanosine2251-2'-O)-methyltransferase